jgi:hypothetical protein
MGDLASKTTSFHACPCRQGPVFISWKHIYIEMLIRPYSKLQDKFSRSHTLHLADHVLAISTECIGILLGIGIRRASTRLLQTAGIR